jgi:hypothetical protein
MKTLTVEQAASGLERWLEQALAGEDIRIRKGDAMVELRPVSDRSTPFTFSLPGGVVTTEEVNAALEDDDE